MSPITWNTTSVLVGLLVGRFVVGSLVGRLVVGCLVGCLVGCKEGCFVGCKEGCFVGSLVGFTVRDCDGNRVVSVGRNSGLGAAEGINTVDVTSLSVGDVDTVKSFISAVSISTELGCCEGLVKSPLTSGIPGSDGSLIIKGTKPINPEMRKDIDINNTTRFNDPLDVCFIDSFNSETGREDLPALATLRGIFPKSYVDWL